MLEKIQETAEWLLNHTAIRPKVLIVLGTGLKRLAEEIEVVDRFPYKDIPNFPISTVEGHSGQLLFGYLGGKEVVAMEGRFHYYEGYSMLQVTFPTRVMREMGVKNLFVSNAAGGVDPDFEIGDLMLITDHINFLPEHPLRGKNFPYGPRFLDMSDTYDKALLQQARDYAKSKGIRLMEGVYLANTGPTYETPAEYHMYHVWGANAVGMSTVPEVIVAHHCGMRIFGMSVITDLGVKGKIVEVTHEEVQHIADGVQPIMADIFRHLIAGLD